MPTRFVREVIGERTVRRLVIQAVSIACALPFAGSPIFAQQRGGVEPPRPMRSAIIPPAVRAQLLGSLTRATEFLRQQRQPDGGWEQNPGVTALAALAILREPNVPQAQKLELTKRALDSLVQLQKPDGGIYDRDLPDYVTSVAITALAAAGRSEDKGVIERARQFLVTLQLDEGEGLNAGDKFYGGMGYGGTTTRYGGRADVISLEWALRALKEAGLGSDPTWQKAVKFLQRCQNNNETNDQRWAGTDGGFVYYPGFSLSTAGELHSYGSATYAGLLGYADANVPKSEPQVEAVLKWIRDNYTVEENPGLGQRTVYYYYMAMAKALQAMGDTFITDAAGRQHNWRDDLGKKLISLQHPEGYWVNSVADDMEGSRVVVTALAMVAIQAILQ